MTHPHEDQLLLMAYGELEETAELEGHLAECPPCRERFLAMERGRVAVDWATERRGRPVVAPNSCPRCLSRSPTTSDSSVGNGPLPTRVL